MMEYKEFSVEDYKNILDLISDNDRVLYGENKCWRGFKSNEICL